MPTKYDTSWAPYGEPMSLRKAFDRLLAGNLVQPEAWRAAMEAGAGILPLDMYEEGNTLVVKAALPGLKPEDVKIQVRGDVLTISGESKQKHARHDKQRNYRLREQSYGRLERSVTLPVAVDASKAEAVFANGVLTLTLPITEAAPPTQIAIKTATEAPKGIPVAAPQSTAEAAPQGTAEVTPQSEAEAAPQGTAEVTPQSTVEGAPQSDAEAAPQSEAEAAPRSTAEAAPQSTVAAAPQSTAEAAPQGEAEAAPQSTVAEAPQSTAEAAPQSTAEAVPQNAAEAAPQSSK